MNGLGAFFMTGEAGYFGNPPRQVFTMTFYAGLNICLGRIFVIRNPAGRVMTAFRVEHSLIILVTATGKRKDESQKNK
jgi:hypothetical protein